MKNGMDLLLEAYPADVREEDVIMLAVQIQEKNDIVYNNINIAEKESAYIVTHDLISAAGMEEWNSDIAFARKYATYVNTTRYEELKECIGQIFASPYRVGIDNIVYSKNEETGTLDGNINLYFYSVSGTGKEYIVPDIAQYSSGTKDLFKADKVVKNHDLETQEDAQTEVQEEEVE